MNLEIHRFLEDHDIDDGFPPMERVIVPDAVVDDGEYQLSNGVLFLGENFLAWDSGCVLIDATASEQCLVSAKVPSRRRCSRGFSPRTDFAFELGHCQFMW
mmetsp:Transcript_6882/g.13952  ORF Transcript_6882/g.13952 Transcript_6882/m.13952 type:complete len:101 (+) Transcript_6882:11-313(+)